MLAGHKSLAGVTTAFGILPLGKTYNECCATDVSTAAYSAVRPSTNR